MSKKNKKGTSDTDIISRYSRLKIPILALNMKPLTTHEALVTYLHDEEEFNYHNISVLLGRDERDVRKVYFRAQEKLKK